MTIKMDISNWRNHRKGGNTQGTQPLITLSKREGGSFCWLCDFLDLRLLNSFSNIICSIFALYCQENKHFPGLLIFFYLIKLVVKQVYNTDKYSTTLRMKCNRIVHASGKKQAMSSSSIKQLNFLAAEPTTNLLFIISVLGWNMYLSMQHSFLQSKEFQVRSITSAGVTGVVNKKHVWNGFAVCEGVWVIHQSSMQHISIHHTVHLSSAVHNIRKIYMLHVRERISLCCTHSFVHFTDT